MTDSDQTQTLPSAGILRRFAAMVYDTLLLLAVIMAYFALVTWLKVLLGIPVSDHDPVYTGYWNHVAFAGLVVTVMGFFCFFWLRSGQTLGMRAWRMKVVNREHRLPNAGQCVLRCVLATASLLTFGLGYFWRLLDPKGYTFHDRFSGTEVLVLPKVKKH